jgi:hypothetical protein
MQKILPIPAHLLTDYIPKETLEAIIDGIKIFLLAQKTGQSYWMSTQEITLIKVPEELHSSCTKFKTVVVANNLDDRPLEIQGIFIYCADTLSDMEAINSAQGICTIPPSSLS